MAGLAILDYAVLACAEGYWGWGYLTAPYAYIFYFVFFANVPGVACSNPIPSSSSLGLWDNYVGSIALLVILFWIFTGLFILFGNVINSES